MTFHVGIREYLRAEGLTVVETNGWQTRGGEDFAPRCSGNHHTAGSPSGSAPSLRYVIENELCNFLQSRQRDARGLDVVYLVAAGTAAHAGKGSWRGKQYNRECWGLEIEHVGTTAEPFPDSRLETSVRVHAACARYSRFGAEDVWQHREWAANPPGWPGRKTDFVAALLDANAHRSRVARRLDPGNLPATTTEDDPVIPSWAKPLTNGRWPHFHLAGKAATAATITATPGAPFKAGLDQSAAPKFGYGSAYGLSTLTVTGLSSSPIGLAEAPNGDVILCCADGSTFEIADKPAA